MAYQYVREPMTNEEADILCASCQKPLEKLIIWTLLDTGLRVGELCKLTPENILWQQKLIRVNGKGGPFGKMTKKRVVPMSRRVEGMFTHHFAILNHFPVGPRRAQEIVKEVANRAKFTKPVTPHVLRHTFATTALQKGISLATVKKILGHDRLSTTEIYLNFTDVHVADEFNRKW